MALLPILEFPDPRLRTRAVPVVAVDARIQQLVDDMFETMYAAPGIGLAASQVDVHERVIVMDLSEDHSDPRVFINPEITVIRSDLLEPGEPDWAVNIDAVCGHLDIFEMAATDAGEGLNHDTFLSGIEAIGDFDLASGSPGFLGPGVYDARSSIRLVEFDITDLPDGGTKPFGPIHNINDLVG